MSTKGLQTSTFSQTITGYSSTTNTRQTHGENSCSQAFSSTTSRRQAANAKTLPNTSTRHTNYAYKGTNSSTGGSSSSRPHCSSLTFRSILGPERVGYFRRNQQWYTRKRADSCITTSVRIGWGIFQRQCITRREKVLSKTQCWCDNRYVDKIDVKRRTAVAIWRSTWGLANKTRSLPFWSVRWKGSMVHSWFGWQRGVQRNYWACSCAIEWVDSSGRDIWQERRSVCFG